MRSAMQFIADFIFGVAVHVLLMFVGLIVSLALFGKRQEGMTTLTLSVFLPFLFAGMCLSHRRLKFPRTVAFVSSIFAPTVPLVANAAYWDWYWYESYQEWNWNELISNYVYVLLGVPCSVFGAHLYFLISNRQDVRFTDNSIDCPDSPNPRQSNTPSVSIRAMRRIDSSV